MATYIDGVLREFAPFFVAPVEVSANEINALYSAPKELVPAPGGGKVLQFHNIMIAYDWGGTGFTKESASYLEVHYTDRAGQSVGVSRGFDGFLDHGSDIISLNVAGQVSSGGSTGATANAPLVLCLLGGDPSGGNGVLHIRIAYSILDTRL